MPFTHTRQYEHKALCLNLSVALLCAKRNKQAGQFAAKSHGCHHLFVQIHGKLNLLSCCKLLEKFANKNIVVGGDFNCASHKLDRKGGNVSLIDETSATIVKSAIFLLAHKRVENIP